MNKWMNERMNEWISMLVNVGPQLDVFENNTNTDNWEQMRNSCVTESSVNPYTVLNDCSNNSTLNIICLNIIWN